MKIMPVALRYEYGDKTRGDKHSYIGGYDTFRKIADRVVPFWFDEYLGNKKRLHSELVSFAQKEKPDVITFSLMKDEISFETLDELRQRYITLNWFGDDTWRFDHFTKYYAPHFTYVVTTDKFSLPKYKDAGIEHVLMSQWAAHDALKELDVDSIDYEYDITFVGLYSGYRDWVVRRLRKAGFQVDCFGSGWPNEIVSFEKMEKIFKTSRINLNISNSVCYDLRCLIASTRSLRQLVGSIVKKGKKTAEQIKARNFEIPAFGGFQLTNYAPGLEDYFHIGQDIAVYNTIDDLILQIKFYQSNENLRREIIRKSHALVAQKHTYLNRFREIFTQIGV
jgi:spore maturation protein CgeB